MIYLFRTAWKYSGEDRWRVILFFILHTISYLGELLQPFALGMAINSLQVNGIDYLRPTYIWLGIYLLGFFIFQIFHHTARYFEWTSAFNNQQRFINDMYSRLYNLPMKWHMDHHSGEVVNRVNVAGQALRDFGFNQHNYVGNLILSWGPILVLTSISWKIALICFIMTGLNLLIVQKMNKAIQPILHRQNESFHHYAARIIDFVGNIKTIISLGLEQRTSQELNKRFSEYYLENMNEFWINQPRCFIIAFGAILTELTVILYYIWSCKNTQTLLMVGTLVSIVNYFKQMRDAFFQISSNFYETMHWKTCLQAVDPIVTATGQQVHGITSDGQKSILWQQLSIQNLLFKYQEDQVALQNLCLDLNEKSKIAIVGVSGSGKSTLLNLLAGLFEPDHVDLFLDGTKTIGFEALTDSTILFPQDAEIFENNIRYNITFDLDSATGKVEQIIDMAQLRELIERLPNGLETDVREKGVNLSGGEKQRLALARGLFFSRDKKILLLDEVTSSLDAFNEKAIFEKVLQNYHDRCVITTIHRLHLTEMFDTVLVMDQGQIVQQGTFTELINQKGHFKNLWDKYLSCETDSQYESIG